MLTPGVSGSSPRSLIPSPLDASDEPNRWCEVLHVEQRKYDWLRTRPVIFFFFFKKKAFMKELV